MAPQILDGWPSYLTAGTDWRWRADLRIKQTGETVDPADGGWSNVKAYFLGKTSIIVTASVTDGRWLFTATDTDTAAVGGGSYRYQLLGEYGGLVYELAAAGAGADSTLEILPTPAVSAASDQRTHNEIMLAKYQAELQARVGGAGGGGAAGSAHEAYTNGDISLQKLSIEDIEKGIQRYATAVQIERNGGRLPPYAVVFTRPGVM